MSDPVGSLWAELQAACAASGLSDPRLEQAYAQALEAHAGQTRAEGAPYVVHPLRVARVLLCEWGLDDADVLIAALLHDAVEDSPLTLDAVEAAFGGRVRALVDLLTKPALAEGQPKAARDAAYWERLAHSGEEASLIKGADRLDNVRSMIGSGWPEAKQRAYLDEAEQHVVPYMGGWPQAAIALAAEVGMVRARLDDGQADLPDVGPHERADAVQAAQQVAADPVYRRSPHLSFFRREVDLFLYHDLVGDIMQLHEQVIGFLDFFAEPRRESEAREHFAQQFELGDLDAFFEVLAEHLCLLPEGTDDEALTRGWYPIHGPWVLSYQPQGGGVTLAYKQRGQPAGEDAWPGQVVLEGLPALEGTLFRLCDGKRSLPEVVARLAKSFPDEADLEARVYAAVRAWTHSSRQLLKLLPRAYDTYELVGLPPYVQSTMPFALHRAGQPVPAAEDVSTRSYHRQTIADAEEQFEYRETTISHGLREPHPALAGRAYGGQLARRLVARDLLPQAPTARAQVVEVGGGVGVFAKAFLDGIALQAPRLFNRLRYTIVDLSPALRRSQRAQTRTHADKVRLLGGDAARLPLADASVAFLVSNEVIADLLASPVRYEDLFDASAHGEGLEAIRRYGLETRGAPGRFHVNTGALRFLEEIARVLEPGGTAVLTEYGSESAFPVQSTHLDHPEFSIHFGHLAQAGAQLGLECAVEQLGGLLDLDGSVEVLQTTQSSFESLQALFAHFGVSLRKLAYTREQLSALAGDKLALDQIKGLRFGPCGERLLGLRPGDFLALTIRKPRQAGREAAKVAIDF